MADPVQEAFERMMTAGEDELPARALEFTRLQVQERESRITAAREEALKAMGERCRVVWEVLAGVIPGEPIPELTRRWAMTSAEWEGPDGERLLRERTAAAEAYAAGLRDPRGVNWVRLEWLWL